MLYARLPFPLTHVLYDFFWRDLNNCLISPDRAPTTDHREDSTRARLGEPMFISLHTEAWLRACVTQKQSQHQKILPQPVGKPPKSFKGDTPFR